MADVMTRFARRASLLLVLSAPLTHCVSTSEQMAQRNNERCAARGLQPNTDAFNDCVVRLEGERLQRMDDNRRRAMEKFEMPVQR